jgi:hypothetical protein
MSISDQQADAGAENIAGNDKQHSGNKSATTNARYGKRWGTAANAILFVSVSSCSVLTRRSSGIDACDLATSKHVGLDREKRGLSALGFM